MPSKRLLTLPFTAASLRLILRSWLRSSDLNTTCTSSVLRTGSSSAAAAQPGSAQLSMSRDVAHVLLAMFMTSALPGKTRRGKQQFRLLSLLTQRDAAENERAGNRHGQRQRFAEYDPRPHHAEQRHEICDSGGARRADAIDQSKVDEIRDAGAEHPEQHRAHPGVERDRRTRPGKNRERCEQDAGAHERRRGDCTGRNARKLSTNQVAADAVQK